MRGVSLTHPFLASSFFYLGVSLTHPVLALFFCGEFFLHIPCWLLFVFNLGSFSYTSRTGFIFIWGVSLIHPMVTLFLCGEFLLHIPCWLPFYLGTFSYTSHVGFLFNLGNLSYTFRAAFFFFFFFCSFYLGSFSYTLCAGFFFYVGSLSGMQSSLKTTPKEKSWVEDGPEGKKMKKSHSKQRRNPTTPYSVSK